MSFLRNCWYIAAWSDDVPPDRMLARTILDEPVLLVRSPDGKVGALRDRCPHRFAPLSLGDIKDGVVTCAYHGLCFDAGGQCISNPHGPIVRALFVQSWPLHEAHRALWIWMGDPDRADPALIPDLGYLSTCPQTAFSKGYLASHGHAQLYVDNILDLSHTDYLHPTTLGGGAMTRATPKVDRKEDRIIVTWEGFGERPSPFLAALLPQPDAPADIWAEVTWFEPGVMILVNGATPAGQPRESGVAGRNLHAITPETATASHYFFAATRNFRVDDAELNDRIASQREQIFATEDKLMIEAQQRRIGAHDFWSLRPALLRTDQAAVLVRRHMDARIAAEQAQARAVATPH